MTSRTSARAERLAEANRVIEAVSRYGRRFFYSTEYNRISRFELDPGGRLRLIDRWTGKPVYIVRSRPWRQFSEGGTLRALIEALAGYIRAAKPINPKFFGPWPEWYCEGDLWGYGKGQMAALRAEVLLSPAVAAIHPTSTSGE